MSANTLNSSNTVQKSKFKVTSETEGKLLAMNPVKSERKLYTSNIHWHGVNISVTKRRTRGTERENGTKARQKLNRTNTKSCRSKSST
jgi:hypothetical protein